MFCHERDRDRDRDRETQGVSVDLSQSVSTWVAAERQKGLREYLDL